MKKTSLGLSINPIMEVFSYGFFNITRFGLDNANLVNKEDVAIDIGKGIVYKAKQKEHELTCSLNGFEIGIIYPRRSL